jgi:serine/threonine-protein kinase RsbW
MADTVVSLRFPAKADYLLLARLALSGIARQLPVADDQLADLKLALTEACGNAVRHAYADTPGDVSVVFEIADERLLMTVEDRGDGIRVPDALADDHEEPSVRPLESGMGMPIIRAIVDELVVESGPDGRGTRVLMVKYLTTSP